MIIVITDVPHPHISSIFQVIPESDHVGECVCYEVSIALDFIDLHVVASASTVWLAGWSESQMLVFTVSVCTCLEKTTNCISI